MAKVHTFRAKDGSATGASRLDDGANLPGGASAWVFLDTIDEAEMTADLGVIGIGNAAEIREAVSRDGFLYVPNGGKVTVGIGKA